MSKIAFTGAFVFDSQCEEFIKATVFTSDGIIEDVSEKAVGNEYEQVSLDGKYIIPGLVDVHTHGIGGDDFNLCDENGVKSMRRYYAKNGTTAVMATLASDTYSRLKSSIFAINKNRETKNEGIARIFGTHLEGRYLNPEMKGAHALDLLVLPNEQELNELSGYMMPLPIHISMAPELEGGEKFIKKALEIGATVGIAHTASTYEEANNAVAWGATSFTHTFNAMSKVHHRMPGTAVCALTNDDAYAEVIVDGEHLHPAIVKLAYKAKPKDKLVLITDSMSAAGLKFDGEYFVAGTKVIVKNGRALNEFGVLAGSTLTLFKAVKNLMSFCGITLDEALKCATVNPARMVGAECVGQIKKGYFADFIVISDTKSPEIEAVYTDGVRVD